ncbi:uncharacterized protein LOC103722220 [Phoenix dactylifera]|uniref:Uncharacterized protein LOC103722220 n=1 Tax=Phoenix dactylifera TaxID=42345 RepID=A0A8B7D1N8_PHODC|nr:uncharacterized protein LOC103722220 [Phoenix dactylifera]
MAQFRLPGADRTYPDPHGGGGGAAGRSRRIRRSGKAPLRVMAGAIAVILALVLLVAFSSHLLLSRHGEIRSRLHDENVGRKQGSSVGLKGAIPRVLRFGKGSGKVGWDSRQWDKDDRRRDRDYAEEDQKFPGDGGRKSENETVGSRPSHSADHGLYNEGGRAELDSYRDEYEVSLKKGGKLWEDDVVGKGNAHDDYGYGYGFGGEGKSGGDAVTDELKKDSSVISGKGGGGGGDSKTEKKLASRRKPRHHKFSGSSCKIKFFNSTAQLVEPLESKKFSRFSLQYKEVEDRPNDLENWEPRFAGHQSPQEREESYYARDQKINCGFVRGPKGSPSTGFDMAEDDVRYMSRCHIAVSSCIFGKSDSLRTPYNKVVTRLSRKNVCFIMFMDEITLQTLLSEGQKMDGSGFIGLWKIVVVKNLPSTDMRRVGKIPKFLTHRLFPSARYSIWLDSKLRLQSDPLLILEYFLWRKGYEYAISNHYDRHCVWEEVMQNKKLNKFNHTLIDQQFEFYQADGLKRFDPSDPNKLLPSYVPEGSFIVRAHTPMSNLFSCLWFNEVDHFTSRGQLSFAYTYLKLRRMNPTKPFYLNMFKDCARRSVVKLFRHRAEDKGNIPKQLMR